MSPDFLPVFIGSGEASLIERKVLEYSLRKYCGPQVLVHAYNGTHDTVEYADGRRERLNTPLPVKYANLTEFSHFRWFIPQLCGHQGRAMYLDSDMVCLSDLGVFTSMDMKGAAMMCKANAFDHIVGEPSWGLSMILFDCTRCRMEPEAWFEEIARGDYTLQEMKRMQPRFLAKHPFALTELPPGWNVLDRHDPATTHLIHYTRLSTQPWRYAGHPAGEVWFRHLHEAMKAGVVTEAMVQRQIIRGYVREDLLQGNFTGTLPRLERLLRRAVREVRNR